MIPPIQKIRDIIGANSVGPVLIDAEMALALLAVAELAVALVSIDHHGSELEDAENAMHDLIAYYGWKR